MNDAGYKIANLRFLGVWKKGDCFYVSESNLDADCARIMQNIPWWLRWSFRLEVVDYDAVAYVVRKGVEMNQIAQMNNPLLSVLRSQGKVS